MNNDVDDLIYGRILLLFSVSHLSYFPSTNFQQLIVIYYSLMSQENIAYECRYCMFASIFEINGNKLM